MEFTAFTSDAFILPLELISPDAVTLPTLSKNNPAFSSEPVVNILTPAAW